jgi:hypothetical protein
LGFGLIGSRLVGRSRRSGVRGQLRLGGQIRLCSLLFRSKLIGGSFVRRELIGGGLRR